MPSFTLNTPRELVGVLLHSTVWSVPAVADVVTVFKPIRLTVWRLANYFRTAKRKTSGRTPCDLAAGEGIHNSREIEQFLCLFERLDCASVNFKAER